MSKFLKVTLVFAAFMAAFVLLPLMALQASTCPPRLAGSGSPATGHQRRCYLYHSAYQRFSRPVGDPTPSPASSNPGMARTANVINMVRAAKARKMSCVGCRRRDAGHSALQSEQGRADDRDVQTAGVKAATFGNHEFDWGQTVLITDTQAGTDFPYVTANIVSGTCDATDWTKPSFVTEPYVIKMVGAPGTGRGRHHRRDDAGSPANHHRFGDGGSLLQRPGSVHQPLLPAMKAAGAQCHRRARALGYPDGGYGYGIPVYGDQTLAKKLVKAEHAGQSDHRRSQPYQLYTATANHSHRYAAQRQSCKLTTTAATSGDADLAVNTSGAATVTWQQINWQNTHPLSAT